jgi:hypothetical protein
VTLGDRRFWQRDELAIVGVAVWVLAFCAVVLASSGGWAPGNPAYGWLESIASGSPLLARLALVAMFKGLILGGPPLVVLLGLLPLLDFQVGWDRCAVESRVRLRFEARGLAVAVAGLALGGVVATYTVIENLPCHALSLECAAQAMLHFMD